MVDDLSGGDQWLRSINDHLGMRIRARRKQRGMTQTQLGQSLGLTFQQVQKYEQGSNRISAARLPHVAQALDVPLSYFYEGFPESLRAAAPPGLADSQDRFHDPQTEDMAEQQELLAAFHNIRSPEKRRLIIALLKTMRD